MEREIKFRVWYGNKMHDNKEAMRLLYKWAEAELMQYTGYRMFNKNIYFDDLVSKNFETSKEVIRQIVEHKGCIMMKRIKGNSSLPKYISLHEWHELNFKIIGNIYENPELLK